MRLKKPKAIENDSLMKVFLSGNLNYKFELTTIKITLYDVGEPKITHGQATKGAGRMPWHWEPMKDVVSCDKLWGVANRH